MVLGGLWHGANDNFISEDCHMVLVVYRMYWHEVCVGHGKTARQHCSCIGDVHLWCGLHDFQNTSTEHALFFYEIFILRG